MFPRDIHSENFEKFCSKMVSYTGNFLSANETSFSVLRCELVRGTPDMRVEVVVTCEDESKFPSEETKKTLQSLLTSHLTTFVSEFRQRYVLLEISSRIGMVAIIKGIQ